MVRLPRRGSPRLILLFASPLLAFLGLVCTGVGASSLLAPSNDRIGDALYLVAGVIITTIAILMFTAGIKPDDTPESSFSSDTDPRERITNAKTQEERELAAGYVEKELHLANDLTATDRKMLDKVKTDIMNALSPAEVIGVLSKQGNGNLVLANSSLQPIAFAMRPVTTARYVRGVVLEALTWAGVIISIPFTLVLDVWRGGRTVMYVALRLIRRARQYRASPHNIFRRDQRAPVLYLRSFLDEYDTSLESYLPTTSEEKTAKHYNRYGPVIAIGRPDEDLPLLGASRLYFDEGTWQAGVLYLMSVSQLVIIQAGIAPGLLWELGSVRKRFEPQKLIISFTAWEEMNEWRRDLHYLRFKKYAEELLGCELPPDIKTTSHISFGTGWLPEPKSEFLYSIPSVRKSRGRTKRIGAAVAIVISAVMTLTLGTSLRNWTKAKLGWSGDNPIPSAETLSPPAKRNHYTLKLAGMSVDAPAEPQPVDKSLLEEKMNLYRCDGEGFNAVMGYMRFPKQASGEAVLTDWEIPGATNASSPTTQVEKDRFALDKDKFALDGKFTMYGTEYKLRGNSWVKGQEAWFIRIYYPSNNRAAGSAAQYMLDSVKISGETQ